MSKEKVFIFDTTLRDGAQTEGVNFSIDDKNKIAKALSDLGVDYLTCHQHMYMMSLFIHQSTRAVGFHCLPMKCYSSFVLFRAIPFGCYQHIDFF